MKKNRIFCVLFVCLLLFGTGCGLVPEEEEILSPPVKEGGNIEYVTQTVQRGDIAEVLTGNANISSNVAYDLSFPHRGGYLAEILAKEGQSVKAGDVLARLDTDSLETDIQIKELQIQRLQLEQEQIWSTASDWSTSYYASEYKNIDLQIAQLELENLKLTLEKSTITAPVDGVITFAEDIAVGEHIAAQKTLFRLADPKQVLVAYEGSKASDIKLGMDVTVTYENKKYPGTVVMTPKDVPAEEREFYKETVHIDVPDLPASAKIGNLCQFEIVVEEKKDVILAPKSAIVMYIGTYYARVLSEEGIRSEREVQIGIESSTHYEILSGLQEGDTLIIE